MNPVDPKKRPSARPSARPAASEPKPVVTVPTTPPTPHIEVSGHGKKKKNKKQRIAARRSSIPQAPENTDVTKVSVPAPKPVTPPSDRAARPTAPARPTRTAKARAGFAPTPPRVPVEHPADDVAVEILSQTTEPEVTGEIELEDDVDVFGEGFAASFIAPMPVDAEEPDEVDVPRARAVERLTRGSEEEKERRAQTGKLAQSSELLGTDYYFRQYGAHGIRSLSAEVDDFGLDPHFEERARPALETLVKRYFRVDVDGAQHVPAEGPALIVANRSGALPWDGLVLRTAMRMTRPELSPVRWLAEDSVFHYPFLGVFMNRLGAVRACPENAERLLAQRRLVAVFPEGVQGASKLFKERYRLQRFGRGGYVKLALKHGTPVIPTAIIGAEETNPLLGRARPLARAFGASYLPITPTFPWLGPAGLLPAPVKWRIVVGEPVDLSSYGPDAAEDALAVHRINEQIRSILQSLVDQARASRRSALFG